MSNSDSSDEDIPLAKYISLQKNDFDSEDDEPLINLKNKITEAAASDLSNLKATLQEETTFLESLGILLDVPCLQDIDHDEVVPSISLATEDISEHQSENGVNELTSLLLPLDNIFLDVQNIEQEEDNHEAVAPAPSMEINLDDSAPDASMGFESNEWEQRGRKKKKNITEWKENVRKRSRNLGEDYESKRGKFVKKRMLKPACGVGCRYRCGNKVHCQQRQEIFDNYWKIGNYDRQKDYILKNVVKVTCKQKTTKQSRRNHTVQYFLNDGQGNTQVCKTMFLNTLAISEKVVHTALQQRNAFGFLKSDGRGKHNNHKQIDPFIIADIKAHINRFPKIPSHYCRKTSTKQYLSPELNVKKMYNLYVNECRKDNKPHAKEHAYRQIFSGMNLSFHMPKKDLCEMCEKYKNSTPEEKEALDATYAEHIQQKQAARDIKYEQKLKAKSNHTFTSACFDLEQVLPCPKGENTLFYYKRKLSVYNLSFYDFKDSAVSCFMWDETIAKRGANEISSCVSSFVGKLAQKDVTDVVLFSDNCAGQNKNKAIVSSYIKSIHDTGLNSIRHVFLEKGHTQNENDSVHAVIENAKKHLSIFVPEQYFTLVRNARKSKEKYNVFELSQRDVFDYKTFASHFKNFTSDTSGSKVHWGKIREFYVCKAAPHSVFIKYQHGDPVYKEIDLFRRQRGPLPYVPDIPLKQCYTTPLGITDSKYNDLDALCKAGAIPHRYHRFYNDLPHSTNDSDSDSCQE